jgi:Ca-activated chloride channel family protein
VFLIDVSGSMNEPSKLPLVIQGLQQLTRELGENDRVAIVVYASSEGLVLPSTPGSEQQKILEALGQLQAGGSTAGGAGIQLAYQIAEDNYIEGGTNRVILCTDGDFNVGVTSTAELERLCEQKAKDTRVFLSVLGFGRGNLNDAMMQAISTKGNGNHHYVDNQTEARRVLVEEMTGTLITIAKDVKIQVEFNPQKVAGYRLIGYENRMLRTEDFNDDKKDAGEIGAGHTVTALYEVVPAGKKVDVAPVDDLKYQQPVGRTILSVDETTEKTDKSARPTDNEFLTLKMRYKAPEGDTSKKLEWPATDDGQFFSAASQDFQFAAAVAGFGLLLRDSQFKGNLTCGAVMEVAQSAIGEDKQGYRAEFIELVRKAKGLRQE